MNYLIELRDAQLIAEKMLRAIAEEFQEEMSVKTTEMMEHRRGALLLYALEVRNAIERLETIDAAFCSGRPI